MIYLRCIYQCIYQLPGGAGTGILQDKTPERQGREARDHDPAGPATIRPAARVAQLDRVAASEAVGCGFNSRRAHQLLL